MSKELIYNPSEKEQERLNYVYRDVKEMLSVMNAKYKYFNDRTLKDLIDDSEYRVTGYVPSREEQGKENWQANVFKPVTRNKLKAILASIALDTPDVKIVAENDKQLRDQRRSYVIRQLMKGSYAKQNKEEQIYFEAWENAVKGTVITYEGYARQKVKQKNIKSYDIVTGEIETEDKETIIKDECVEMIIPLENLLIKDISIRDIQDQPAIAWVELMHPSKFKRDFSGYKNFKYVKEKGSSNIKGETKREFSSAWEDRITKESPIEVIRFYNKFSDEFIVVANGVVLLDAPMLLGKKEKKYPFAKTIFEPFAIDFFYGNPIGNTTMGNQDVINSLYNMALDKTFRSMNPPLIIGAKNKDDFDLEDDIVNMDTKIYVEDINAVKEMPIKGVDQGMLNMMDIVSRELDLSTVDANQQGVTGRGVTAREVVIANENAKKLKGVLYMFLTSLWIQKYKLRIENILTYYTQPKIKEMVAGKETGRLEEYRKFMIENAELADGTKGTLGVQMVGGEKQLPEVDEIDKNEKLQENEGGENYEEIAITSDYLLDWEYDVKVISDSIHQKESSLTRANIEDKIGLMAKAFPQFFQLNEEKLFKDTVTAFDDDPDEYTTTPPAVPEQPGVPGEGQQAGVEGATAGQSGLPNLPSI